MRKRENDYVGVSVPFSTTMITPAMATTAPIYTHLPMPSLTPLFTQPGILLSWLFLGVFGNAVCFALWNIAFKNLGVVITNNYLYATPFVTVVVGWLLLGEKISLMSILGAVLITLGVIFANKQTAKTGE